jgi:hypothetical protein
MQFGSPAHSSRQVVSQVPPDEEDEDATGLPWTQAAVPSWLHTTL